MFRVLFGRVPMATLVVALFAATVGSSPARAGGPGGGYSGGGYGGGGAFSGGGIGGGFYSGGGAGRGFYGAYNGYGGVYGGSATPYWGYGPTYSPSASYGYQAGPYYYQPGYSSPFATNPAMQLDYPMGWDPFAKAQPNIAARVVPARVVPARIRIEVPDPNATVTFDGAKTTSTGAVREFQTLPLEAGQYTYEIQASWMQNGHTTTKTQKVQVTPGAQSIVSFLAG